MQVQLGKNKKPNENEKWSRDESRRSQESGDKKQETAHTNDRRIKAKLPDIIRIWQENDMEASWSCLISIWVLGFHLKKRNRMEGYNIINQRGPVAREQRIWISQFCEKRNERQRTSVA